MDLQLESICILDDDASVRHSIEQLLDSDGLKALSFEDAEGFFCARPQPFGPLALLDVWMPETSGLEVQARLRAVSPDTKVILMTGRETPAIRIAALKGGAFAFLVKPFDDEAFLSLSLSLSRPSSALLRGVSDPKDWAATA